MKGKQKRVRPEPLRYRPVFSRGECAACGHWAILQGGVCAGCRKV